MLIPKGILIDCCCVLFVTNLGSLLKDRVPQTIKEPMNVIFGLAAIAIGITSIIKLQTLPAVILALILGGLIGELLGLDGKVRRLFQSAIERLHFHISGDRDALHAVFPHCGGDSLCQRHQHLRGHQRGHLGRLHHPTL